MNHQSPPSQSPSNTDSNPTTSLLNPQSQSQSHQPPTLLTNSISITRLLFGTAALLIPRHLSAACGLPFSPAVSPILLRLFGSRDALMGLYLWQTRHDRDARRPALLLGIAVDAIDVGGALASYYASLGPGGVGGLPLKPALVVGGGALVLTVLGVVALRWDVLSSCVEGAGELGTEGGTGAKVTTSC